MTVMVAVLLAVSALVLRGVVAAEAVRPVRARLGIVRPGARPAHGWPPRFRPGRPRTGRELAGYMEGLARAVRSGSSLPQALAELDPPPVLRDEVDRLRGRVARGLTASEALAGWRHEQPRGDVALAAAGLELAGRTGGEMARAFDAVAGSLRERASALDDVRSLSTQVRASAALIGALPLAFAGLAAVADPATLSFLVGSRLGWSCLVAAVVLETVGVVWMRRITASVRW